MLASHPQPLAVLHALAVGVFLTIALGLLYQFIPVVARGTLRFPALAYAHLLCAACGTALVVSGFATLDFARVFAGGIAHAVGFALEAVVLAATVYRHRPPAAAGGALASLAWLVATLALGSWLAWQLAHGVAVGAFVRAHGIVALAGFFGTIVAAITLRLLRMFERVDREARIGTLVIAAHVAVVLALVAGIGSAAVLAAAALFAAELTRIARARNPAYQRETLWYAVCSCLGALVASAALVLGAPTLAIVAGLWFFVGSAVVGYLQRIVPFIWWIRRAKREGAREIPTLAQMNDPRLGIAILLGWSGAGIAFAFDPGSRVGAALALLAWCGLISQLVRAFVLRRPSQANP